MIMPEHSLTALIGNEMQVRDKWLDFVDGNDGFLYGIPCYARRVVKFNPIEKSLTEIGPDFGEGGHKWSCGVLANNGNIYCAPYDADLILKINTNDGTVETLENVELPERGRPWMWASGALAADNHIYYMPTNARRIMRLNTDNDSLSSVGDDLGYGCKYSGTVVGNDDCLYGIPYEAKRIVKFDPSNPYTTSTVGEEAEEAFECGNGVLAGDGYIYALNGAGQVLQIDTTSNNYTWIGDEIYSADEWGEWWGDPIVGVDKCIYWPPADANRVLKFDPETQQLPSLVGDDLGERGCKWQGGALAIDGVIYCIPYCSAQILTIDPFKELSMTLQNNLRQHPQELGRLFAKDEEEGCDETFYDSAVRKFGIEKVFQLIEECLPTDEEWSDAHSNALPLFMVAASCENCAASVIYHYLRRNVYALLAN